MSKFIPLESLVDKEQLGFIESIERNDYLYSHQKVRGIDCKYYTPSRRLMWQAVGIEYIEPELLDYIDAINNDSVFYDIGASNGIFSIYAACKGLDVYSFEPEVQNFSLLGMNSYLNAKSVKHPIKSFNIALSDENEIGSMFIAKYEAGGHMKILDKPIKVQEEAIFKPDFIQTVIKFKLDVFIEHYNLPVPEYLKIDVDGAELAVVNGAKSTLKNLNLKSIFIELEEGSSSKIIEILLSYGFTEIGKYKVQNYDGLFNYVFSR
jgi:FkbM family methyltransferase